MGHRGLNSAQSLSIIVIEISLLLQLGQVSIGKVSSEGNQAFMSSKK